MTLRGSRRRDSMFRSVYAAGSDHQLLTSLQHFTWIHISYRSFVPGGYFLLPTLTTSPQLLDFSGGGGGTLTTAPSNQRNSTAPSTEAQRHCCCVQTSFTSHLHTTSHQHPEYGPVWSHHQPDGRKGHHEH